jgi:hypothetical protein
MSSSSLPTRNFPAVKAAFRVMKGKRRIEVLQNKLSEAQRRFLAAVSMETKNDVARLLEEQGKINDTMQNTILPELLKTHASSTSGHAKTHKKLEDTGIASSSAHKTTHSMLANVQRDQKASGKQISTMQSALSGEIAQIEARADKTFSTAQTTTNHKAFLDSLWYAEIFDRQQTIKAPSFDTFEWIFDDSVLPEDLFELQYEPDRMREMMRGSFARWLRDDERLFWISGKVGSGKCSLMSLIQDDPRTEQALAGWAQGRRLHTFSFYFWRPGSPLQKRIHGLLRSLLYQLAKAKPAVVNLISSIRPVTQSDWTTKSLITAFRCALPAFCEDRVFLMVDGLDEYEDQYTDLLDLLLECQQMEFIKLCIASRPETAILTKLNTFPSLRLQDLNAKDIDVFVRGKLGLHTDLITNDLISDLVYRADGVFLWAVLVTNSMVSGVTDGDDVETLRKRLHATPSEINALFSQLLGKLDEVHYDTLKICFFHLDERKWSCRPLVRCSVGLITASLLASRAIATTTTEFVALCVKNSERLVSLCKGLVEIQHNNYLDKRALSSAWNFDFATRQLLQIDLCEAETCWTPRIRFVHRSAHDFLFGPERHHIDHSPWTLGSKDLDSLTRLTLTGLEILLRFSPMVSTQPSSFVLPDFATSIDCATGLVDNIKGGASIDFLSWLDDMYRNIEIWYPIERRSVGPSDIWMTGSEPPWSVEMRFWYGSLSVSGYLESRWDVLVRNPYARGICSGLLRMITPHFSFYTNESIYKRLSTFLEEGPIETLTPSLQHLRKTWGIGGNPDGLSSTQVSWDAGVPLNEQHVIANLMHAALRAMEYQEWEKREVIDRTTVFPTLLRRHKIFIGRCCLSRRERFMLNIQIPSHTAWHVLRASGPEAATLDHPNRFRLLCLASCDETPLQRMECWTPCTEGIVGLCDIDLETLKPLCKPPNLEVYSFTCEFPDFEPFEGTQDQYLCCLEEVKQGIWANKKGQLDAWQQLCMLACVKKNFGNFWNIITPETHELAQISL